MPVDYTTMTDPSTGKPFASQDAGQAWSNAMAGQSQAAGKDSGVKASDASLAGTGAGIDWSKTGWNINYEANGGHASDPNWYKPPSDDYGFQIGNQVGYFDPTTGKMTVGNSTLDKSNPTQYKNLDPTTAQSYTYAPTTDYGLGSTALGIIPLEHNSQGQVSVYLAPGANGGFQKFSTIADAQASVAAYNTWKATQPSTAGGFGTSTNPANTPATTTTATTGATTTQPQGILTVPGAGENYFDSTKDFYTNGQPTNAQKVFDQTPNQPTNSQQQWNAYSGIYGNPDYLKDYYGRQEQAAELTQARRDASAGIADTGAAAKATANLPAVYGDRAIAGMNQFATTGQQMAGAADSANNTQTATRGGLASSADTQNLSKVTGGQSAANSAETQMINRETGGLNSATQLAQDQSTLVASGFNAADAQTYSSQLATIQLQMQQGQLTAQQAYTMAQNLAQTMGVVGSTALNAYLMSKLGGTKTA